METEQTELARLKLNEANPRQIRDSRFTALVNSLLIFPKMLEMRPIVCDDDMTILAGNMRYRALLVIAEMGEQEALSRLERVNGWDKRTETEREALKSFWGRWFDKPTACMAKASGLSDEEKREFIIKDNASFGEWDWDMLTSQWDAAELRDWGVDFPQEWAGGVTDGTQEEDTNNYTRKIEVPQYEPSETKPELSELFDRTKYDELVKDIDDSGLPEGEKEFLRLAASRHIVFNYGKVADYYAHSGNPFQKLAEDSTLVVIDFDDAIQKGFVQLCNDINETYKEDYDEA